MKRLKRDSPPDNSTSRSGPSVVSPLEVRGLSNIVAEFLGPRGSSRLYETSAKTRRTLKAFESERFGCMRFLHRDIGPCLWSAPLAGPEGKCNRWCKEVLVEEVARRDADTRFLVTYVGFYEPFNYPRLDWQLTSEDENRDEEDDEDEEEDKDESEEVPTFTWTTKSKGKPPSHKTQRSTNISPESLRRGISQIVGNASKEGCTIKMHGHISGGARPTGEWFPIRLGAELTLANPAGMPLFLDSSTGPWELSGARYRTLTAAFKQVDIPLWVGNSGA